MLLKKRKQTFFYDMVMMGFYICSRYAAIMFFTLFGWLGFFVLQHITVYMHYIINVWSKRDCTSVEEFECTR